uniref:ADAMTS/ADAMTS-like cysteine-rich domain-containing protein n=1 Tax=Glossina austeni TaxID=7395 RepID=A0A1A9V4V4_GLOAU
MEGRPAHLSDDISPETTGEDGEHYDELSVVVQLTPRVQDGTRCRSGSLDMCIQGKCQRVGCDLKIGSTKKVDSCGVCGGDGSSCSSQTLYHWEIAPMSLCSVSCGGDTLTYKSQLKFYTRYKEIKIGFIPPTLIYAWFRFALK